MLNLGNRIKKLRALRDMNQDQLSLATGIDRSKISRIEGGYVTPTEAELATIKSALGWPSEEAIAAALALLAGEKQPCGESAE